MDIEINKSNSRNVSEQIKSRNSDIKSEIANINNSVTQVSNAWKGQDSDCYKQIMNGITEDLTKITQLIDTYSDYLSKVPGMYDAIDDSYCNKI